jgi:pyruvate dehydrogenase E2 component (dihydrolipoamide acetyltransferase)
MAQETGVLLRWLKAEGEQISQGEPLMEIETDKATVEVESPATGTLVNVTAGPGDEIPVGQVIALILAPGETASGPAASISSPGALASGANDKGQVRASPLAARIAAEHNLDLKLIEAGGGRIQKEDVLAYLAAQPATQTATPTDRRVLASPKARRLAGEKNLALATITGSGPEGAVLAADVLAVAAQPAESVPAPVPAPPSEEVAFPMSRMWQVMVRRLTESWQTAPHFYLAGEVNASRLIAWREGVQQRAAEKITYTDLMVKLVAAALRRHPRVNAGWVDGAIMANHDVNIGLAVAVEEGLIVPVIHQADQLGLSDIATRRIDLVAKAQAGKLSLDELRNGTFTISNLGMYGVDVFNAIVNPPQAAILALGRIADRVVPVNGQPAVQPMIIMTLSCDHRVVDGARAAQFLQTLAGYMEDPLSVLD